MKKIMFNDKYGLTESVLSGTKTTTRRIEGNIEFFFCLNNKRGIRIEFDGTDTFRLYTPNGLLYADHKCIYAVGQEVAIAQSYMQVGFKEEEVKGECFGSVRGWKNKMYVKAELMPHRVRITDIKLERLQDITEADCLKEGIRCYTKDGKVFKYDLEDGFEMFPWSTMKRDAREAFAALIDKVSGNGTWENNPYVFVYEFELLK